MPELSWGYERSVDDGKVKANPILPKYDVQWPEQNLLVEPTSLVRQDL